MSQVGVLEPSLALQDEGIIEAVDKDNSMSISQSHCSLIHMHVT